MKNEEVKKYPLSKNGTLYVNENGKDIFIFRDGRGLTKKDRSILAGTNCDAVMETLGGDEIIITPCKTQAYVEVMETGTPYVRKKKTSPYIQYQHLPTITVRPEAR